jgi:hypothetical protein
VDDAAADAAAREAAAAALAEQVWASLAALAAADKKGFLARFTLADPAATGTLSAHQFGQVLDAAMADASSLDGGKAAGGAGGAVIVAPDVCALLMRAADPQSAKLLLQQQQQHAQQQLPARGEPQQSALPSSPPPLPPALRSIEYRKFVHAVNARGRSAASSSSGVSAAEWLAGQHAKAALASVVSPTKCVHRQPPGFPPLRTSWQWVAVPHRRCCCFRGISHLFFPHPSVQRKQHLFLSSFDCYFVHAPVLWAQVGLRGLHEAQRRRQLGVRRLRC